MGSATEDGRSPAERVDQAGRVIGDHLNGLAPEELGQDARHGGPICQHVAYARGAAKVVLEHAELAVLVANHVDPRHVDTHPVGRRKPVGGADEAGRAGHDLVRDQAVADDPGRAVDVGQEELEGPDPLDHAVGDRRPLRCGKDPGCHVEGERPLLAVEIEGDPLVHEGPGQPRGPGRDVVGTHLGQRGGHPGVGLAGAPGSVDHFVEGGLGQTPGRLRRSPRRGLPRASAVPGMCFAVVSRPRTAGDGGASDGC